MKNTAASIGPVSMAAAMPRRRCLQPRKDDDVCMPRFWSRPAAQVGAMAHSMTDAQIAAFCLAHSDELATRNHRHFEGLGLKLISPWD